MHRFVSQSLKLSTFLLMAGVLSCPSVADTPRAQVPEKAPSDEKILAAPSARAADEIKRLQAQLDAALKEIEDLKGNETSAPLPQPESLASKSDGSDPLRSAFPISKKLGLRLAQVHFDPNSTQLSPGSERFTREAVEWIKMVPGRKIIVAGFADRTGSSEANKKVSADRAQSVASMLEDLGVDPNNIEIKAMGEENGPEPTEDGTAEPLNRCAAIFLAHDSNEVTSNTTVVPTL